ncbi:M28 family peptidase [Echinicola sp. CAU 1574]|uniref:M28 family peptidase n=1 Tax=Echinicola arenosa TaxID=2774144 RepID=A0ABR9AKP5_9BACT|nr:M28 family peptidase [Echinicola arenosa]MBD8489388.1 M28 family peptidase [Echinicola arenosa]
MKKNLIFLALAITALLPKKAEAQKSAIDNCILEKEAMSHFRYLASDELMGRDAARPEIDIAARYVSEQFWKYGAKAISDNYFQSVPFRLSAPPSSGTLKLGSEELTQGQTILVLDGKSLEGSYEMVVAGYGLEEDLAGKDISGKILVVRVGGPEKMGPSQLFAAGRKKLALAQEKGAIALIEMYNLPTTPWTLLTNYLNKPQMTLAQGESQEAGIPYIWAKDLDGALIKAIDKGSAAKATVAITGKVNKSFNGKNVIGVIEGTDPKLKEEYVMLSAHYDHIGVGSPNAEGDTIYNGARDNAVGTVAIINAAKFFAEHPPKRSILLCAWTAEEKGLLGSAYFSEHPLVPLNKIIYNLNIDNGGYNNTEIITVIGLGRTSADHYIKEAVSAYGLETTADPSPEQGLYDRSDNVNFAKKGIPAPTFSLGFTAFDAEIMKYYHQAADEVDSFDLDYAMKYWKSYLLTAQKIANAEDKPIWEAGDKYEEAGKALYGTE